MTQAYPLSWPEGWARTPPAHRKRSQFKTGVAGAVRNVMDSVRTFSADSGRKVEGLVISSNVTLMNDEPADPGVAVYFTWDGISTCLAVDRYPTPRENLQAIHHCLEAERTKLRHGGLNLVRAAFRGYAALPPPQSAGRPWWMVLGYASEGEARSADLEAAYRRLAMERHPDRGGSVEKMSELNAAMAEARKAIAA